MKRWLAVASGLLVAGASAPAQTPPPNNPGYFVIRIKVGNAGSAPAPGGAILPAPGPAGGPPPLPSGPPGTGSGRPDAGSPASDERSVIAVVPVKSIVESLVYPTKPYNSKTNPKAFWASHEYGRTLLFGDRGDVQLYPMPETVEREIKKRHSEWAKDRRLDGLLDIIVYALSTDHVELALTYSAELEKAYDPSRAPKGRMMEFVRIYREMKPKFEEALPTPPDAEAWRKRLKANGVAEDRHYALIHFGEQSVTAETLNRRLAQLERNFKAFYLWHAVQGQAPRFPDRRLVAVLSSQPGDIEELRPKLDGSPILSDAFYSPTHNLVVLAPARLDEAGKSFGELAKAKYQDGWNREELLKGKAPIVKNGDFNDLYRTMTYALADRILEEESAQAAITREGNRQLFSTLGVLPKHVVLPKWIDSGIGSLLQKPKNAGVVKLPSGKNATAVGLLAGYGSANYVQLREWRDLWARKELAAAPKDILMNVLTDRYFEALRSGLDLDPAAAATVPGGSGFAPPAGGSGAPGFDPRVPGRPPIGSGGPMGGTPGGQPMPSGPPEEVPVRVKLEAKAHATSWALMHYLAKSRTATLYKFFADLDKLPRDMRIDRKVVAELFAVSFSLMNDDRTAINEQALKVFAGDWIAFINAAPPTWTDQELAPSESAAPGSGPVGIPGGAGGGIGGPGSPTGGRN